MSNELVDLEVTLQVVGHKAGQLAATLDTTESASFPYTASDELEGTGRNFLASGGDTNDDGLAPTLVASFERGTHHTDVTCAVKGVVAAAVSHVNKLLLDALAAELGGVDKVGSTKLLCPLLFGVVDINDNNPASLVLGSSLDDGQTDTASAKDGNVGSGLDTATAGSDDGSSVTGGDTAAEQAGPVHGSILGNGNDGDVGDNGVLGEGGCSHEVEEVLALAPEARSAVGHDTLSLCGTDLSAEVGLARLAELAFLAFWGAVAC